MRSERANLTRMHETVRRTLISERRFSEALELQQEAIDAAPDDPRLRHEAAWLLGALRRHDEAIEAQRSAVRLAPGKIEFARQLASLLEGAGRGDEAEAARHAVTKLESSQTAEFERRQTVEKERYARLVEELVRATEALPLFTPVAPLDRSAVLFAEHAVDSVAEWAARFPQRYGAGEVAHVAGIGAFEISDPNGSPVEKRLSRGIAWELPIAALLQELAFRADPGSLLVDVGANTGTETVCMARWHRGAVLAFEPFGDNFTVLQRNLALNHLSNVTALAQACSDRRGDASMVLEDPANPGMARLSQDGGATVPLTLLDEKVAAIGRPVALIKLDVEGHEAAVLRGARETLARDRPVIVSEVLTEASDEILSLVRDAGYTLHKFFRSDWVFLPAV
jgi:FkbM family methyltransferase